MAATAPTLGGQAMPHPYEYRQPAEYRGGRRIMSDGTMVTDLVSANKKHIFTLRWRALTSAQKNNIHTAWATVDDSSAAFVSPDNSSYTVTQDSGNPTLDETLYYLNGTAYYDITMTLREV